VLYEAIQQQLGTVIRAKVVMLHTQQQCRELENMPYSKLFWEYLEFTCGGIIFCWMNIIMCSNLIFSIFIYLLHALAIHLMINSDSLLLDSQIWSIVYYTLLISR